MTILIIAGLIPIVLYFWVFHSGLAQNHTSWGEFGSFLSPIISILAFAGLLYSVELTKNQFQRQSEDSTFFSLINLHVNKVNQMTGGEKSEVKGVEAFRYYASEFGVIYNDQCFYYALSAMANETAKLPNFGYQFLYKKMTREECPWAGEKEVKHVLDYFERNSNDRGEALKQLVNESCSQQDREEVQTIGALVFEDSSPEFRIKKLSGLYELFYDKYGHVLGHYFRNMYYILRYIDETKRSRYFSRIYRAQLSRYELAMLFYNIMGPYTSPAFNRLVFKYDMLDDLFAPDLCYAAHEKRLNADLDAIKRYHELTSQSS
jgi:hypothetical protein